MSKQEKIYIFQCGRSNLYGFTTDQSGKNLPEAECPTAWRFFKEYKHGQAQSGMIAVDNAEMRADFNKQGYHLVRVGMKVTMSPMRR